MPDRNPPEALELDAAARPLIRGILERYADLGPRIADASLVYIAERDRIDALFTLGRRDFTVFRLRRGRRLQLLP